MTILVVAAESYELAGLLRRCRRVERSGLPLRFARTAEIGGHRLVIAAHGPGPDLAGAAASIAARKVAPDAVLSTGVCGALDPSLNVGDVFVAESVTYRGRIFSSRPAPSASHHRTGALISSDRVAATAGEKEALRTAGAAAVDMEAGALAEAAASWSVPFFCIRAISDRADENLPLNFNDYRDRSGYFSRPRILAAALREPVRLLPALIKLRLNCGRAARTLGEFLAGCRF